MATKKMLAHDQESLADALFPIEEEEFEEAILSIPPEKRILRTEQYDFSVSTLVGMMDKGEVEIPEFQRRYVWSDRQASRLVESLIIQCPIPVIYLNQEKDETFSVIDGNQRLNSLKRFVGDAFPLIGLTSYPELAGLKYSQLDKRFQRHISNRVLRCTVILKETHPQVKFDVFERLNSGAVALTRQELRHGLYYGSLLKAASSVAKELKLDSHFGGRKDKRMKAEELVIRYWALSEGIGAYEKPLASFISTYAETNRNPSDDELEALSKNIRDTHARAVQLFGPHCFSFSKEGTSRFNAAVFDAQMIACSKLTDTKFQTLEGQLDAIRESYEKLQKNPEFARSVTLATSDKAALQGRIHKVSMLLKNFL
ncbi:DUF262 domain-containing protein [Paraburkholderia largidicola]|uniref:GmrSD restriction endonucleases N-terminal domain-containing protein n=1 Tax=Paraburkholderia largidicola TaxID=3014751 RepID=A0A7I8BMX5_9BURK|nr:DUF262 domain-containing protein [Paraburkholderia sp. PGU16]BCF90107.1 hypothetical protein PPGU16_31740 [Paraburkholderia sp. PGU16]